MIEALVLSVLESVLSRAISDTIMGGTQRKQRKDLLVAVQYEFERREASFDTRMAEVVTRELDRVVAHDPFLRWKKQRLVVAVPPSAPEGGGVDIEVALDELRRSIADCRSDLDLPPGTSESPSLSTNTNDQPDWRAAVNELQTEVSRERRQRGRKAL